MSKWVNASNKKHTQQALSTKMECDYLYGEMVTYEKNLTKNEPQR